MEDSIKCPKCGSTQLSANKKGWTMTTGMIGSSKILITCLKCGKQFKPGDDKESVEKKKMQQAEAMKKPGFWIFFAILFISFILLLKSCTS
jgi:DNA-directed RNA polymerase subunit RPC12/RpoP